MTSARPTTAIRLALSVLIVAAVVGVYANGVYAPFMLDDGASVVNNPTIRNLWRFPGALHPPADGSPVQGRPIANLTLAINYALGQDQVVGYRWFNVALHALNCLLLFGIVRRTLETAYTNMPLALHSTALGFAAALLWGVHPLASAAVDYVSQRTELLVSLFFLLTFYCTLRAAGAERRAWLWQVLAVIACLLGMGSKEVMVSVPLLVLLFDRIFLSGSFRECFRRRGAMYAGLAASWVLLGALVITSGTRAHTAGLGGKISVVDYALTQCTALALYLKLQFWPHPLVFDYGPGLITDTRRIWPLELLLLALLVGVMLLLILRPRAGFLGVAWFAILAPTSSVIPIWTQTIAEHRAYLPLAAMMVAAVVAAFLLGRRAAAGVTIFFGLERAKPEDERQRVTGSDTEESGDSLSLVLRLATQPPGERSIEGAANAQRLGWATSILALAALTGALGYLTHLRNQDYRDEISLWQDVIHKWPRNARAYNDQGSLYFAKGDYARAIDDFTEAIRIQPDYASAYGSRGSANNELGRPAQAVSDCDRAIALDPKDANAYNTRALAQTALGHGDESLADYAEALRLQPDWAPVYFNRGNAYCAIGQPERAIGDYTQAIRLQPGYFGAVNNRGGAYASLGQQDRAIADFSEAIRLRPHDATPYLNRATSYIALHHYPQARQDLAVALHLPGKPDTRRLRQLRDTLGAPD